MVNLGGIEPTFSKKGLDIRNSLEFKGMVKIPEWCRQLCEVAGTEILQVKRYKYLSDKIMAIEWRLFSAEVAHLIKDKTLTSSTKVIDSDLYPHPDLKPVKVSYTISSRRIYQGEAKEMNITDNEIVLVREGVARNRLDQPVMISKMVFRSELVNLQYDLELDNDELGGNCI
jgi:DNA-binding GntR family transcriptional regulator